MTISKKNQPSEESVGHAPYYRTSSPLSDQIEQVRLSTKHMLPTKEIKVKEMEIVQLNVQDPTAPVGCPVLLVDESGNTVAQKLAAMRIDPNEYFDGDQLQCKILLDGPKIGDIDNDPLIHPETKKLVKEFRIRSELTGKLVDPYQAGDHGNSHNRVMVAGSKITDCFGSKGVVVRVLDDTEMPTLETGAEPEYSIQSIVKKLVGSELWKELRFVVNQLNDIFGKDTLLEMAQNNKAPAVDVYAYVNGTIDGAAADYVERAIGEQYGIVVLNKAKAAKDSRKLNLG